MISLTKAIQDGNQYRLGKYGIPKTLGQDWLAMRATQRKIKNQVPKCLPMFASNKELQDIDIFKSQFAYWDEWTGARYHRRENPWQYMSQFDWQRMLHLPRNGAQKPIVVTGAICRSDPSTGYWHAL